MAMTSTTVIMLAMSAASTVATAAAQKKQAAAEKRAADARAVALDHQAAQARAKGVQEVAVAQRSALDRKREGDFISSRALALAAASGAGVADPTTENILGAIGAEAEFRALSELFMGKSRKHDLDTMADLRMFEGAQERIGGEIMRDVAQARSTSTLIKGASSTFAGAYKAGAFKSTPKSVYG